MAFNATLEVTNGIGKITLSGELDAATAPEFRTKIEEATEKNIKRLVLIMTDLEYMASAGLRMLVFAKQKMSSDVDIYIIGAQEAVSETIEMTGFQHSVVMLDEYDADKIEKI